MKKFLLGIATFITMAVLCVVSAGAETYGDYTYTLLDDGTVEITDYTGSATELEIPSEIAGNAIDVGIIHKCILMLFYNGNKFRYLSFIDDGNDHKRLGVRKQASAFHHRCAVFQVVNDILFDFFRLFCDDMKRNRISMVTK